MRRVVALLLILVIGIVPIAHGQSTSDTTSTCRYLAHDTLMLREAVTINDWGIRESDELSKIGWMLIEAPCDAGDARAYGMEEDQEVTIPAPMPNSDPIVFAAPWGIAAIHAPEANQLGITGQGAIACIIDTGLNNSTSEFGNRVLFGKDYTGKGAWTDGHGHGTHVAGTVASVNYGVAPGANLIIAKVLSDSGSGALSSVTSAIVWCADNGASVANMSLGSSGASDALADAVAYGRARNMVSVAAAGNDGQKIRSYPGDSAGVIGVIAIDQQENKASFSNYGYYEIAAPGVSISSIGGAWNGTSMASPHVAGVVTLLAQKGVRGSSAEAAVLTSAKDIPPGGFDESTGYGRVDALAAVSGIQPAPTTTPSVTPRFTPTPVATSTAVLTPVPSDNAAEVVRLINEERVKAGLSTLRRNDRLDNAAQAHSVDLATHALCGHTGSDGLGPGDRINGSGYSNVWWGETVGCYYTRPADVVAGWMASPGHREILMKPDGVDIGSGYSFSNVNGGRNVAIVGVPGGEPQPTSTPRPIASPTLAPTSTPTRVATPTATSTPRPSITNTPRPSVTVTPTPSNCMKVTGIGGVTTGQMYWLQGLLYYTLGNKTAKRTNFTVTVCDLNESQVDALNALCKGWNGRLLCD